MRTRLTPKPTARRTQRRPEHGRDGSTADNTREQRARAAGGPEDTALYSCACGEAFEAAVSTSVACPHCGSGQDW